MEVFGAILFCALLGLFGREAQEIAGEIAKALAVGIMLLLIVAVITLCLID